MVICMLIVWTEQYAAQYAGYTGYNDARADQSLKMTGRGP